MELQIYVLIALAGHLLVSWMLSDEHEEVRACGFVLCYFWPCLPVIIVAGLFIALCEWLGSIKLTKGKQNDT